MKSTHRTMTVAELVELDAQEALQVDAEYQRGAEWSVKQERLLIDSLFRGYSIPLFYFHKQTRATSWATNTYYFIIDGQQRKNAIIRYCKNQFSMFDPRKDAKTGLAHFHKGQDVPWGGVSFNALPEALRQKLLGTTLQVVTIEANDSNEIRDLFIRLQSGLPLTAQEKRDAWPGEFTKFVIELGGKTSEKETWRGHEFFRKVLKGSAARGNRRKLCATMFMQFYSRRANRYSPESFTSVNALDVDNFYQHHVDFDSNADVSHAPRFRDILDEAVELLGDGHRPRIEAHMAYNVVLLLDVIMGNFARSWRRQFVQAFDEFQTRLTAARKGKDPTDEYWGHYGSITGVSASSRGHVEQRYRFFERQMLGQLTELVRLDSQRGYTLGERELVFYRDGGVCQLCRGAVDWEEAEIDHIVPHAVGGATSLENARLVHRMCHARGPSALDGYRDEDVGESSVSKPWEETRTTVRQMPLVMGRRVSTKMLAEVGLLPDGCRFVFSNSKVTISAVFREPHRFVYEDESGIREFEKFREVVALKAGPGQVWSRTEVQLPDGETVRLDALRAEYIDAFGTSPDNEEDDEG